MRVATWNVGGVSRRRAHPPEFKDGSQASASRLVFGGRQQTAILARDIYGDINLGNHGG